MATPSLNSGLFLRDTNYVTTSHIDSYHLMNQLKDTKPDDMGIIDLWAMLKKVDMPWYSMANLNGRNVELVEDLKGRWTWQTPVVNDLPSVVEDIDPSNTTKGIDGQTFRIKLSRREFGKGEIITYDKFIGLELYIVPQADIIDTGDHAIYTVQLVNNDNVQYLDNAYLATGVKYFRSGSARGEYGQVFADMRVEAGFREFYNMLPTGEAHVHYSVSSRAKLIADGGINADGTIPVTEIWKNTDPNMDPSVTDLTTMTKVMGADYIKKARANGTLSGTYLTKLDAKHVTKVGKDIETYLVWGKGGRVRQDGPDDIRMACGLWKQLDSGYKTIYNRGSFSLALLRTTLYNYYNNKENAQEAMPTRILDCQIGLGMSYMLNTLIAAEAAGLGWIINADKSGANVVSGESMNLGFGYYFREIIIPHFAVLRFRLNPAFDPGMMNTIENPMVDGYPLSSYSMIIHDINDAADNVKLKKAKWDPGFRWWYNNGTMDYFGKASGFQSSSNKNGFEVFMTQLAPALWVKDPTRMLKIVMKNSITGGSL